MGRHIAVPGPACNKAGRLIVRVARAVLVALGMTLPLPHALTVSHAQTEPPRPIITAIPIPNLPLGVVIFPNGKAINLHVGIGSAAFRHPQDSPGRVWFLTDRGPNIDCTEAKRLVGLEPDQLCGGEKTGRVYPLPGFAPSIYGVDIGPDNTGRINAFIPLKGKSGKPVSGRPPLITGPRGEAVFSTEGKPLPPDPSGIDPEAFVRLADGSFWIAEEFGPSLLRVAPDGTILKRLVPQGSGADFKDADYEIHATLPAIMRQRVQNRGIEGLAISPDERFLYVMMQSPLANPDLDTFRASRHVRLWKIAQETGEVIGQYLYQLDEARLFATDHDGRERPPYHVHASELVAIGEDKLLVLERIEKTSRVFTITLSEESLIPPLFNNPEKTPSLEAIATERLIARGIIPLAKTLILDSDQAPGLIAKIEGIAVMGPKDLIIVNDNDFGIDGVRTQMFRVTLPQPLIR